MKVVIVVPTYNERENIEPLIAALQAQFGLCRHDMHILVVDDSSPDGTADVVRRLQSAMPNLHMITGRKSGLGAAYIRGMHYAMNALQADAVFEMDADFSHDPKDVPRLLAELENGADFVIGSRYVKGGSIPANWSLLRKANSRFGNIVARHVAGIRIKDCTAGFRAIRSRVLEKIDLQRIGVQGYAFQVALLHRALVTGAVVKEVPVQFVDREHGDSKLGLRDIVEFFTNAWWIRLRNSATFLKFGIVGLSGVLINLGMFSLLMQAGMDKFVASPLAIEASIIWNFLFNNYWTFKERKTRDRIRIKGLKFNAVSLLSLGFSYLTFVLLSLAYPDVKPHFIQLVGIVPAAAVNYFLNSYWTFKKAPREA